MKVNYEKLYDYSWGAIIIGFGVMLSLSVFRFPTAELFMVPLITMFILVFGGMGIGVFSLLKMPDPVKSKVKIYKGTQTEEWE